jgi:hypothetical protein
MIRLSVRSRPPCHDNLGTIGVGEGAVWAVTGAGEDQLSRYSTGTGALAATINNLPWLPLFLGPQTVRYAGRTKFPISIKCCCGSYWPESFTLRNSPTTIAIGSNNSMSLSESATAVWAKSSAAVSCAFWAAVAKAFIASEICVCS